MVAAGVVALVALHPPGFAATVTTPVAGPTGPPTRTSVAPATSAVAPTAPTTPVTPTFDRARLPIDRPESIWVVVDKLRPLDPIDFVPGDLVDVGGGYLLRAEAAGAMTAMLAEAAGAGLAISVQSAYRSYDYQQRLFATAVSRFGEEGAEQRSARPGYSEHQTGLAADVGGGGCDIESCFATTAEGQWVAANGHRFGFVVSYPDGAQAVTGYKYEPWHIRYVGVELATEMHETGVATLAEFFGLPPAPDYAAG